MKLQDGDYILAEGAGWFETGRYAIRIYTAQEGGVVVEVYENGKEYNAPLDACCVLNNELGEAA